MAKITLKNVALPSLLTFMSSRFSTHIGIFLLKLVAKTPYAMLYFLADIFYVVLYYMVGYRKKVVVGNLKKAFPEKKRDEINRISKKYYRHLSDLFLESAKMHHMKESDFKKRMVVKKTELLDPYFEKGQSVVILTMHYNNWEWSSWSQAILKHKILAVYKPLHNRLFDEYTNETRSKMGLTLIPNSQILRTLITANKKKEQVAIWLAADQTPPSFYKTWFIFLNQEALFYTGPAFIAKRVNYPVFFQWIEKTSRGKYQSKLELLFENPSEVSEVEIMKTYIYKMEDIIREKPEYYLWSHKRWKHLRPNSQHLLN